MPCYYYYYIYKSEDLGVAPQIFGPSFHLLKSATPYVTKYQGD